MPLKLSLKPGERVVLNGAVLQNGDRRSSVVLQSRASVLRDKDVMRLADADTPAKRLYFNVMMIYLAPDARGLYAPAAARALEELAAGPGGAALAGQTLEISRLILTEDAYGALAACRRLLKSVGESVAPSAAEPYFAEREAGS